MGKAAEVAEALIAYDRRTAAEVLTLLCVRLGGPASEGEPDVEKMRQFMSRPDPSQLAEVGDPQTTTAEWKAEFAQYESMRALGAELAERLR